MYGVPRKWCTCNAVPPVCRFVLQLKLIQQSIPQQMLLSRCCLCGRLGRMHSCSKLICSNSSSNFSSFDCRCLLFVAVCSFRRAVVQLSVGLACVNTKCLFPACVKSAGLAVPVAVSVCRIPAKSAGSAAGSLWLMGRMLRPCPSCCYRNSTCIMQRSHGLPAPC